MRRRNSELPASKAPASYAQAPEVNAPDKVTIDFPREGERVGSTQYAVKISTGVPATNVDVSIDGSAWKPCREAVGHWWFDWNGLPSRVVVLHARALTPDGKILKSLARRVVLRRNI